MIAMTWANEILSSGYGIALAKKFPYASIDQKIEGIRIIHHSSMPKKLLH